MSVMKAPNAQDNRFSVQLLNTAISINGLPASPFAANYYCNVGDTISITGTLDLPEPFTVPVTVKMPVVRYANGQPTQDEFYLDVTIVENVVTSTGAIPWSGDWKVLVERNNKALQAIGAPFKVVANDVTFLA